MFATIAEQAGQPLALVEPGTSAGLCLYPDRWRYRWEHTDKGAVSVVEPVETSTASVLACRVTGSPPLPSSPVDVAWRGGVDLNPLDVSDDDSMAWLATLVWPEQEGRRERLRAGIEVARVDPPYVVAGDLFDELPALVAEASRHGQPVVFHSAVIAYLEPVDRERFVDLMAGLVADGACRWVSNEGPRVLPGVAATGPAMPDGASLFVLGLDGRAVAWTHGHGSAMTWLNPT